MFLLKKKSLWLALAGIAAAICLIVQLHAEYYKPMPKPMSEPAKKPYASAIGATGIVEAAGENTAVGVPVGGIVSAVTVSVGSHVNKGDVLLVLDSRDMEARLRVLDAEMTSATAESDRASDHLTRLQAANDPQAIAMDELMEAKSAVAVAKAKLGGVSARLDELKTLISLRTVRAPIDGTILSVKIKAGEYAVPGCAPAPITMGNTDKLWVLADVDENLAARIVSGAPATATPKGNAAHVIPLRFVRIDPLVVPKRALSGASTEMVDTRVLRVVYEFDANLSSPVYVGQQMALYISGCNENPTGESGK